MKVVISSRNFSKETLKEEQKVRIEKKLEAAEELIAEKGFEETTVRNICQKANINVAMISYYFGSKEKMMKSWKLL